MPTSANQQSKPKNTICRHNLPDVRQVPTSLSGQMSDPEAKASDSGSNQSKEIKIKARFGPTYEEVEENFAIGQAKESAWKNTKERDGENKIKKAIKSIETEAMECYESSIAEKLKQRKREMFRLMMAKDGCFFLHRAIHILAGGELLPYPDQDPYFGKDVDSSSWIPEMFFVGNQIPCVVINALMKQPFFQDVIKEGIKKGKLKPPPVQHLAELALYQTIVEPHLKTTETEKLEKEKKEKEKEKEKDIVSFQRKPSEILEALRNLHLEPRSDKDPIYTEMKDFQDLEAGMDGKDNSIPGAGDLYKQGIKLVKGKAGITNIRFENWGYAAFLYVPPFTVDKHTEKLLTSLANWELLHLNESERELTSYLRFMRDLARTYKDFKILEGKGIICVEDNELKRTMVQMLDTIVSGHNSNYTLNFRQIRREIKDYGGLPWRLISFCLGVLTVVQTIFTVLSYCFPPRT